MKAIPSLGDAWIDLPERSTSKLTSYRFLHSLFKDYSKGTHMVATAAEGMIVPHTTYSEAVLSLDEVLGKYGRPYTLTGYIGSGHIAATASFDAKSLSYEHDLQEYREKLFALVATWKGGISAVGGDGLERTAALPIIYNEAMLDVFKRLKNSWDPYALFNPSKKLSITKDYLVRHAARTLD
jgi:FAD/FMN-containing dehydrogenase